MLKNEYLWHIVLGKSDENLLILAENVAYSVNY